MKRVGLVGMIVTGLTIAFLFGLSLGARIISAQYEPEITALERKVESQGKEIRFWRDTLDGLVNGTSANTERGKS